AHHRCVRYRVWVRVMNADPRLVTMRLCGNWLRKVELDEISLDNAWDLLRDRVGAIDKSLQPCDICQQLPCTNPSWCEACRKVDQKTAAARRCEQCKATGGDLEPHKHLDRRRIVYLHRGACEQFWKARNR